MITGFVCCNKNESEGVISQDPWQRAKLNIEFGANMLGFSIMEIFFILNTKYMHYFKFWCRKTVEEKSLVQIETQIHGGVTTLNHLGSVV